MKIGLPHILVKRRRENVDDPRLSPARNRLVRAEAALRSIERALDALFKRINVNRKRDPELDAVLDALAAIRHGLDHARGDRSKDVNRSRRRTRFR